MKKLMYIATLAILSAGIVVAQAPASSSQSSQQPMSEQTPTGGNSTNPAPAPPGASVPDNTNGQTPMPGDPSQTGSAPSTSSQDNTPATPSSTNSAGGAAGTPAPQDSSVPKTDKTNPDAQANPDATTPNPHF